MKTSLKIFLFLFILAGSLFTHDLYADLPPDPPPPPGGHGGGNNQQPGGAPIDGGLGILFVLGTAFAGLKLYKSNSRNNQTM